MQAVSYTAQLFDSTHCNSVKEILVNQFKIQQISIGQRQDVESCLQSQLLKCDIPQQQNLYVFIRLPAGKTDVTVYQC